VVALDKIKVYINIKLCLLPYPTNIPLFSHPRINPLPFCNCKILTLAYVSPPTGIKLQPQIYQHELLHRSDLVNRVDSILQL
jgi:hypothetical protein